MARRGIDLLPLLDVFMVVLFVFATIQEQQLDSSAKELAQASEALAQTTVEREQQAERIEQLAAELGRLEPRSDEQAALIEAYERECGPRRLGGPLCPAAADNPDGKTQAEIAALHERLLDNFALIEIEIEGSGDLLTGKTLNRCCYRVDPPDGAWQSCGVIPIDDAERRTWLDEGAEGLVDALARTREGNAVVLLRQGDRARYLVSNDLAELLRERLPSHRVYDDGTGAGAPQCPLLD